MITMDARCVAICADRIGCLIEGGDHGTDDARNWLASGGGLFPAPALPFCFALAPAETTRRMASLRCSTSTGEIDPAAAHPQCRCQDRRHYVNIDRTEGQTRPVAEGFCSVEMDRNLASELSEAIPDSVSDYPQMLTVKTLNCWNVLQPAGTLSSPVPEATFFHRPEWQESWKTPPPQDPLSLR